MSWYKKALKQIKEDVVFETENSSEMSPRGAWLQSRDGDLLPPPTKLGVNEFVYVSYIWVPEKERRQGKAKKVITDFVRNINSPVFVELVDSDVTRGLVLKDLFLSLGFKIYKNGHNYIWMFKQ